MDLIIGLPGEELSDFEDTLRQVGQLAPDSLTIHSLVIKRASRLRSVLEEQGALGETEQIRGRRMEQMLARGEQFAGEQGSAVLYVPPKEFCRSCRKWWPGKYWICKTGERMFV